MIKIMIPKRRAKIAKLSTIIAITQLLINAEELSKLGRISTITPFKIPLIKILKIRRNIPNIPNMGFPPLRYARIIPHKGIPKYIAIKRYAKILSKFGYGKVKPEVWFKFVFIPEVTVLYTNRIATNRIKKQKAITGKNRASIYPLLILKVV